MIVHTLNMCLPFLCKFDKHFLIFRAVELRHFFPSEMLMLGLHYVPGSHGSHGSQKRSSPWCFSHFCLYVQVLLSLATFSHGLSRSVVTEARRRSTVCHGWCYVSSQPATFCWDLSRFVTLRSSSASLQSSVKVFDDETWGMIGVWAPICPQYKEEVHKAAAIVILCTHDQKHHYM